MPAGVGEADPAPRLASAIRAHSAQPPFRLPSSAFRLGLHHATLGLLLAVLVQPLDGGEATRLIRGPWWWHDADGAPCIGIAITGHPPLPAAAELDGRGVALTSTAQALDHDSDGATQVVVMRLPRHSSGTVRLSLGGQPLQVRVRPPPPPDAPARIVLAGGRAWPDRAGIEALARLIGGTPQLVLALGSKLVDPD